MGMEAWTGLISHKIVTFSGCYECGNEASDSIK
jgi:hypothetical protein